MRLAAEPPYSSAELGRRQREVAVARALRDQVDIEIADEPLAMQ